MRNLEYYMTTEYIRFNKCLYIRYDSLSTSMAWGDNSQLSFNGRQSVYYGRACTILNEDYEFSYAALGKLKYKYDMYISLYKGCFTDIYALNLKTNNCKKYRIYLKKMNKINGHITQCVY